MQGQDVKVGDLVLRENEVTYNDLRGNWAQHGKGHT